MGVKAKLELLERLAGERRKASEPTAVILIGEKPPPGVKHVIEVMTEAGRQATFRILAGAGTE